MKYTMPDGVATSCVNQYRQGQSGRYYPSGPCAMNLARSGSALDSLLDRLEALSEEPEFQIQREIALGRALQPYLHAQHGAPLAPLPSEVALAKLYLLLDFYPEDGQPSLIEQLRDTITTHVPDEERAWLDPLHHSHMDLLEVEQVEKAGAGGQVFFHSLGDRREFQVQGVPFGLGLRPRQAVLTRLAHPPPASAQASAAVSVALIGAAVVLSPAIGQAVFEGADRWRQGLEASSGVFALGEWEEFVKRFGYVLLWQLAQARLGALLQADAAIRYRSPAGHPFLYGLALYDHHAYPVLALGMAEIEILEEEGPVGKRGHWENQPEEPVRSWVVRESPASEPVARLTLAPVQLFVECDSRERLDELKHSLASTFGYSLHFRGESTTVPTHDLPEVDLTSDEQGRATVVVEPEEERRLLSAFLETVYLAWVDLPSPALDNQTPRHAATVPSLRDKVAALIGRIEQDDPALRRTGQRGYDYNLLREHVGL